jgi:hypothetical protein
MDANAGGIQQHYVSLGYLENSYKADQQAMHFNGGDKCFSGIDK